MDETSRQALAWEFVEHTGVSIFLTGNAGTGKTTFLKEVLRRTAKTAIVVAPTGVAAINASGVTIHSFFQLSPSPFVPGTENRDSYNFSKEKLNVIRSLDLLIIDEVSMVRADLLDAIDNALRKYRRDSRPFGGVQLLMIGDLQQLAPVVTPRDEEILRAHYSTPYFFGSHALAQIPYVTICLEKVYRQQNTTFVELLNHVRDNCLTPADREILRSRLQPSFIPPRGSGYIRLTTHNTSADSYNELQMMKLPGRPQVYKASVKGTFPDTSYPTAAELILKEGAQVMFIRNDTAGHLYYNGLIGEVVETSPEKLTVRVPGRSEPVVVTPQVWENTRYKVNEEKNIVETEVQGTFSQLPLRPAWAITIHKSQGLTFDKVIIDAGQSFAPGQVYVALSRCRTLEGMVLATPIAAAERSMNALAGIKDEYHRQLIVNLFTFRDIVNREESLLRFVTQNYRHSFPEEASLLSIVAADLRSKIVEISDKWTAQIRVMNIATLSDPDFLLRVRKSSVYFYNTLVEVFGTVITRCQRIKTENKKANQRVAELVLELKQAVVSHLYLLRDISEQGFTIAGYLAAKQAAMLKATRDPSQTAKAKKPTRKPLTAKQKYFASNARSKNRPSKK